MAKYETYHKRKLEGVCVTCGRPKTPGKVTCPKCDLATKKYHIDNPEKYLWLMAQQRAEEKKVPFTIEPSDILIPEKCPALGMPLVAAWGVMSDESPTLDRVIPELGYIPGNIVVVSNKANRIKGASTLKELKAIVAYITKNLAHLDNL